MINKIMQMKERGERVSLECIDSIGFIEKSIDNKLILELENLIVERYQDWSCDYRTGVYLVRSEYESQQLGIRPEDAFIPVEDLKYFKIKEPDFNDLIDVAVQAKKDGVISGQLTIMSDSIHFFNSDRTTNSFTAKFPNKGIERIKSLYTETFLIESEEDIEKLCDDAEITLANNEKGIFNNCSGLRSITNLKTGFEVHGLNIFWLKGATVTQEVSK